MIEIGEAVESRLWVASRERDRELAQELCRKAANEQYSRDRTRDAAADRVRDERDDERREKGLRLAQRLTDEQLQNEYLDHQKVPPQIEALARTDVQRLLRAGRINADDVEHHLRCARQGYLSHFRRAVTRAAQGDYGVRVSPALEEALDDAVQALKNLRHLVDEVRTTHTLPKRRGISRGRSVFIAARRAKGDVGDSVSATVIEQLAADSESVFGKPMSKTAIRRAWKAYKELLRELEAVDKTA